jgi:hypothetical protein
MQDRKRLNEALRQYSKFSGDLDDVDFVPPASTTAKPRTLPAQRPLP